jgi:hypothetical protein
VGNGVLRVPVAVGVEALAVDRGAVVGRGFVVDVGVDVLAGGVDRAVVECFADPQAATPSASAIATVARWLMRRTVAKRPTPGVSAGRA